LPEGALGVQPSQQEQVLAWLVVIDGHQHLPVSGDDQALRLVQPLGQTPHTVDVNQAVLWIQVGWSLAMQRDSSLST